MTVKPSFPMQITYCDKRLEYMFQADINKKWIEKMLICFRIESWLFSLGFFSLFCFFFILQSENIIKMQQQQQQQSSFQIRGTQK